MDSIGNGMEPFVLTGALGIRVSQKPGKLPLHRTLETMDMAQPLLNRLHSESSQLYQEDPEEVSSSL
jgi:hypothetical protein